MNIVVIGGSRGIGFELAKQYKELGHNVIVAGRSSSSELDQLGIKTVIDVDVSDDSIVETISEKIEFQKIDILIHNAGILKGDHFPNINFETMKESFNVNSLGPLRTVMGLKSKLKSGAKIGILSSRVGSIQDNSSSNNYAYRTSKTAVNMIGKCLSLDLYERGIAVGILHPGYVRTDMTAGNGLINADESAKGLIKQIDNISLENTGSFVHSNGELLPW